MATITQIVIELDNGREFIFSKEEAQELREELESVLGCTVIERVRDTLDRIPVLY